ncbi:hypothetical protein HPG69_005103 [Diceros bicornis minor]|uniref:Uncharacterized protein n=1 Tax=Diceros bicornis minor TaxID=77932 RepID=A0A7J7EEX8_DICBM|nr:hypothetical protein HPG69_005103 [Diceros bicornis minor]
MQEQPRLVVQCQTMAKPQHINGLFLSMELMLSRLIMLKWPIIRASRLDLQVAQDIGMLDYCGMTGSGLANLPELNSLIRVSCGSLLLKLGRQDKSPPLVCHQLSNGSFGRAKISSSDDKHQGPCYAGDPREYMDTKLGPLAGPLGAYSVPGRQEGASLKIKNSSSSPRNPIDSLSLESKVDFSNPQYTVVVEIIKAVCCPTEMVKSDRDPAQLNLKQVAQAGNGKKLNWNLVTNQITMPSRGNK